MHYEAVQSVNEAELHLTASGWRQLPSGRWKYPNLLQPGVARIRALTTQDAMALQQAWDAANAQEEA